MKSTIALILLLSLLLGGCSNFMDGEYHSIKPHQQQESQPGQQIQTVSNYTELCNTLAAMVENGLESGIISVPDYDKDRVEEDMTAAIQRTVTQNPIAAYAVSEITFDMGANAGQPAIAVTIVYTHDRTQVLKIKRVESWDAVMKAVADALDSCASCIVLYTPVYEQLDLDQWVANYATANPDKVMEIPTITANVYPESGQARVLELKFTYQNSRDDLRNMQNKVKLMFNAAQIYAGKDADVQERYFRLYSFLMGSFQSFQLETSITPSYSLLEHGVGDCRAFAVVYAAMCNQAGLECMVVSGGTRFGEPWCWNIICVDGVYYHVDLLDCHQKDDFEMKSDSDMTGHVWDYSAYPPCGDQQEESVVPPTEPPVEPTE